MSTVKSLPHSMDLYQIHYYKTDLVLLALVSQSFFSHLFISKITGHNTLQDVYIQSNINVFIKTALLAVLRLNKFHKSIPVSKNLVFSSFHTYTMLLKYVLNRSDSLPCTSLCCTGLSSRNVSNSTVL